MRYILAGGVSIILVLAVILAVNHDGGDKKAIAPVNAGAPAPGFVLPNAAGGTVRLSELRGEPVLLSFVQVHASADFAKAKETRAQMTFIRSMHDQYSPKGLKAILVDAAYIQTGRFTGANTRVNFVHDWALPKDLPLLADTGGKRIAELYGVSVLPTTCLIDGKGVVTQRWDGIALSQQMAFAVEALVGAPWYRAGETSGHH